VQGFVVTLDGRTISFNLRTNQTIHELKQVICDKEGVPVDEQILVYSAKVLVNNQTLATYNITNGATIHLSLRLSGG
ncbi:ubiquitin-related domain-containing protein, partial [Circinella umbellata]